MRNGEEFMALVTELVTAEVTAVAVYYLVPWLLLPSVAANAVLSLLLTTPFVVLSLMLLKRGTYGLAVRWLLRSERDE